MNCDILSHYLSRYGTLLSMEQLPGQWVMSVVTQTGCLRKLLSYWGRPIQVTRIRAPTVASVHQHSGLRGRIYALSRQSYIAATMVITNVGKKEKNAPPHHGSCSHPLGPSLGLIVLVLVCLIDDLFRDDLLDNVCICPFVITQAFR
jgi:hypothetical protein